jgi:hypothetical protein
MVLTIGDAAARRLPSPLHGDTMGRSRLGAVAGWLLLTAAACGGPESSPPAAPLGVEATPGDGLVSLHWEPVAGADSYDVYWSTASGVTRATGTAIPATGPSTVHQGLENGTTYHYVVTASNRDGESTESAEVSATPLPSHYPLAAVRAGTGGGTVASDPAAIDCGATCSASVPTGTVVTLTATPDATSTFEGWSGACTGAGTCAVTMDGARTVTATFTRITYALAVERAGTGGGAVASDPAGIDCGATCEAVLDAGTEVTLTATPDPTSTFAGWSGGGCSGDLTCTVTMDGARSVTATFTRITYALAVERDGTGGGTVASDPAGIDCGTSCDAVLEIGTVVTLTATPDPTSTFAGWSGGGCSGDLTCTVTMDGARSVTATFTRVTYALTVATTGGGTVTSAPAGITCGATCTAAYVAGTVVTLSAVADATATFAGWSGACSGTGACTVTMDGAEAVSARFTFPLAVSRAGTGGGTVTSAPLGISCGATCAWTYDAGTFVRLTAAADADSTFTGWSGACAGVNTCDVTMVTARTVTATFALTAYLPTITSVSPGSGGVEGGTEVTVTGTAFDTAPGGTTVTIGGSAATAVTVSSSTSLTCVAPAGAAGPADVVVTTSEGPATLAEGFAYHGPFLFAALLNDPSGMCAGVTSRVEIVDLAANALASGFDLPGTAGVTSLAVSPDGQRVFLADPCANQVHVYTPQGDRVTDLAVTGAKDLVLSPDGGTLYVATLTQIVAFDASTHAQVGGPVTLDGSGPGRGMALSPDGTTLAVASVEPAVYLLSTAPLARIQKVPITATIPGCAVMPNDVTFTDGGRVLAWDANCDWLYQVDVATGAYLSGSDVAYARDSVASFNFNNAVFFLPVWGKAYGLKESWAAVVSDPAALSGATIGGFGGIPGVPAPVPDERGVYYSVVHRFSGGGADTLDLLDAETETFTRDAHTFTDATRSVRDMRVIRIPGL